MQLVSVTVPQLSRPPPLRTAELPLTVQLVSVTVPPGCTGRRRHGTGGVAADGAVGQRGRAVVGQAAANAA